MKYARCFFIAGLLFAGVISCAKNGEGAMKITSPAFENNERIPVKYTCQGDDINPPLEISEIPEGTKSLALIVDDPDAPMGTWVHWVVADIPAQTTMIPENNVPGFQGWNDFQRTGWGGPCPPSGTHRYFFKVYALNRFVVTNKTRMDKKTLEKLMQGSILAEARLIGIYSQK